MADVSTRLSFYKETLRGETDSSYVYLRAAAEEKEPLAVLQQLVEETVADVFNMRAMTSADSQVAEICDKHLMVSHNFRRALSTNHPIRTHSVHRAISNSI